MLLTSTTHPGAREALERKSRQLDSVSATRGPSLRFQYGSEEMAIESLQKYPEPPKTINFEEE